tara:strand:- start:2853 stop:3095 length:243 start_codon:yes stop_codon:yes gene_type:complete
MKKNKKKLLFGSSNYLIVLTGVFLIFLGFILMYGGGSENPNIFSNEIYSFRRIRLAPALIILGFGFQIFAILKSPNKKND